MKIIFLLFVLSTCHFAQTSKYGFIGGTNFSEAETDASFYYSEKSIQLGYNLGFIADFSLLENLSFFTRFGYAMRKSSSEMSDCPKNHFAHFVDLDLTLKLKFNTRFFSFIGAKVSYLLALNTDEREYTMRYKRDRFEGGFLAGMGYNFNSKIFTTISWYRQLYKDFEDVYAGPFLTNYSIIAEMGYYLN